MSIAGHVKPPMLCLHVVGKRNEDRPDRLLFRTSTGPGNSRDRQPEISSHPFSNTFSHRFRTLVPEDCVGDIEEGPHRDNLRDIGRRYVDVTDLAFCVDYLERWGKRNTA